MRGDNDDIGDQHTQNKMTQKKTKFFRPVRSEQSVIIINAGIVRQFDRPGIGWKSLIYYIMLLIDSGQC